MGMSKKPVKNEEYYKKHYAKEIKSTSCDYYAPYNRFSSDVLSDEGKALYDEIRAEGWHIDMYTDFRHYELDHKYYGVYTVFIQGINRHGYWVAGVGEEVFNPNKALQDARQRQLETNKVPFTKDGHPS